MNPTLSTAICDAIKACDEGVSVSDFEGAFLGVVRCVEDQQLHSELEAWVLVELQSPNFQSLELLQFLCRFYRFQSVHTSLKSLTAMGGLPIGSFADYASLLAVYDTCWPDERMYEAFR